MQSCTSTIRSLLLLEYFLSPDVQNPRQGKRQCIASYSRITCSAKCTTVNFYHQGGKGVGEGQHLKTTSPVDRMMKQPYQKKPPLFLYTAMWRDGLACSGLSTSVLVEQDGVGKIRGSWNGAGKRRALLYEIPREYAFLPRGHLDFESAPSLHKMTNLKSTLWHGDSTPSETKPCKCRATVVPNVILFDTTVARPKLT